MVRRKSRTLTEVELGIMQILWPVEEATVEEIAEALDAGGQPLAPSSIRKMLAILGEKGYVARRPLGRGYTYRAIVAAKDAESSILKDLVSRVYHGSASELVAALVNQGMVGKDDLNAARKLIEEKRGGEKP